MKIDLSQSKKELRKPLLRFAFDGKLPSLKRFTNKQKEDFYREFATLIKAGVDYNQALKILANQQKSTFLKTIYEQINEAVVKGIPLHVTIQDHKFFSPYEYYSIKIGEDTRRLPEIFDQLQKYFARKIKMKRQVVSVLAYPVFVLFITFGVLYFMLNFVVPMFSSIFSQFGKELPGITQFVLDLSERFNLILLSILGLILCVLTVHHFLKNNNRYNDLRSKLIMRLPYFGSLITKIYLARFCQSLSLLLGARTPLITALELTEKMISFYPLKNALYMARLDVKKGETLASSLSKHSFFTPKIISLTVIGEQINELDKMYDNLANQYNDDIDHSTKLVGTILEPVMILLIGSIVGFIMVAMYSPIFNLSKILER
jgi:type IV pilus assembly protein PilC